MPASSKHKYSKLLAFPDTYYELIINLLQSVELFCAYPKLGRQIIINLYSKRASPSRLTLINFSKPSKSLITHILLQMNTDFKGTPIEAFTLIINFSSDLLLQNLHLVLVPVVLAYNIFKFLLY